MFVCIVEVDLELPSELRNQDSPSGSLQALRKTELYRQANAIGRSAQGLDLFEKRMIVLALARIDHTDPEPSLEIVLPLRLFGENGIPNPYARAKQAAEGLPSRVVIVPRDDGGFDAYPWLQRLSYVPSENSDRGYSYVLVSFNEALRPWITNLRSHFAVLPIQEILQLPTAFAIRLYEVLWHTSMAGRRSEITIGLMDLKFALGLVERSERTKKWVNEKYVDWRDFRKQLNTAIRTFGDDTSINTTFKGVRVGRRIGQVTFEVRVTKPIDHLGIQPSIMIDTTGNSEHRVINALERIGFSGNATKLIGEYTLPVVETAIFIAERRLKEGNIKNPGGFLRSILHDGTARQEAQRRAEAGAKSSSANPENDEQELELAWEAHQRETVDLIIEGESLSAEEIHELVIEHLSVSPASKVVLKTLDANGWSGPVYDMYRVNAILDVFAAKTPKTALNIQAFKEFRGADHTLSEEP